MTNDWKKTYLGHTQEQPKKPTIKFHKEELDYVAQQIAWNNLHIPGKLEIDKLISIRKNMLQDALRLLYLSDVEYIESLGYGVRKSEVWDKDLNGDHIVEFYVQPCFIREFTFGEYDGEQIL